MPEGRIAELLQNPQTFASTLVIIFVDRYGTEGMTWAPQTIRMQMTDDFGDMTDIGFDRLMAGITLLTTNYFYKNVSRFIDLCNVLSGNSFSPAEVIPASVDECAWGITEAMLLAPPDFQEDPEPFCEDIRNYLRAVLDSEGFVKAPDVLAIASPPSRDLQAIADDWADDPDMYAAIDQTQNQRTTNSLNSIKTGLVKLIQQLESLPLENGSTAGIVSRVSGSLRKLHDHAELKSV